MAIAQHNEDLAVYGEGAASIMVADEDGAVDIANEWNDRLNNSLQCSDDPYSDRSLRANLKLIRNAMRVFARLSSVSSDYQYGIHRVDGTVFISDIQQTEA